MYFSSFSVYWLTLDWAHLVSIRRLHLLFPLSLSLAATVLTIFHLSFQLNLLLINFWVLHITLITYLY